MHDNLPIHLTGILRDDTLMSGVKLKWKTSVVEKGSAVLITTYDMKIYKISCYVDDVEYALFLTSTPIGVQCVLFNANKVGDS